MPSVTSALRKLRTALGILRSVAAPALVRNEFGIRGIRVALLGLWRHAGPSHLRLLGHRVRIVEPRWAIRDFVEIFWSQIYHFGTPSERPTILDCGANVGLSVIYFKLLHPRSRVIAFEADPGVFAILERNVAEFGLTDVTLVNKGVWTAATTMAFSSTGGVGGHLGESPDGSSVGVETVRLADYLGGPIDLLKLDIEGAEEEVLRDCRPLLRRAAHIFVEFHGDPRRPQTLHEVLRLLSDEGFRYYVKDARGDERPLDSTWRWHMYDLQVNVFAIRE